MNIIWRMTVNFVLQYFRCTVKQRIHSSKTRDQESQQMCWQSEDLIKGGLVARRNFHSSYSTIALVPPMSTNGCLAWYNVVITPQIHSTVKYRQLGQLTVFHARVIRGILTIRHTTSDIRCRQRRYEYDGVMSSTFIIRYIR